MSRSARPAISGARGCVSPGMLPTLRNRPGASLIALAAFLSFLLSVSLWFLDSHEEALFVGLWVPSILALGAFYVALGQTR